jgi:hypothetical protein
MAFEDGEDGGSGGAADLLGGAGGDAGGGGDQGGSDSNGDQQQGGGDADPSWYESVSADAGEDDSPSLRDWLKSAGIKDVDQLAKVARDNVKALRDSGRIKVPGENATPEELAAYRKAVGVPDDPAGYEFAAPVGENGEPIQLNDATLTRIAEFAHKHGLPKGPMQGLVADYIQAELDQLASAQRDLDAQAQKWVKQQGGEASAKIAAIDRAARALDLSSQDLQQLRAVWGPEKALSLMARLGEGMAEDVLIGGGKGRFGVTGAEAQAEIDRLSKDADFLAKVKIAGSPEAARWKRLNDAAGEAANRAAAA